MKRSGLKNSCFTVLRCADFKCYWISVLCHLIAQWVTVLIRYATATDLKTIKYHKPSYFWSSHLSAALINCSWSCCYQRWWFSPWFPSGVLPHSRTGNSAPGSLCGRSGRQVSCTLALLCLVLGGQRSQTRTKSHHSSPH